MSRMNRTLIQMKGLRPKRLFSTDTASIASSFLSRFQSHPQTRTQTLDANQLHLLSLTLNRPSPAVSASVEPPAVGTPLPPGHHLVYFTPAFPEHALGLDGTDTSYNPSAPFTRRMWAGGQVQWPRTDRNGRVNHLRVGQEVSETTRVVSAEPKVVRRTGEEMIVVGVEKVFGNEDGVALVDRRNWVFRKALELPDGGGSAPAPAPTGGAGVTKPAMSETTRTENGYMRTLRQSPVSLFRFSALTFNPHKIHYSVPWARDVEGHSDIVVHGPLNLICILDLWRDSLSGGVASEASEAAVPESITYRATSPVYAEEEYRIMLDVESGDVRVLKGDVLAMKAEIRV